ncbi:C-X-C motif chemokine 5 [Nothobranchius furzeri]|uniref:Growth-regulated alpha protein-like n=2 Tax=Nothobranchius furzeri TaxID=105023 RepID=A0A1A8AYV7_NOTFU|nr:growth-regulated alpha protein [Nothobranchius furzeri]KAF7229979.1 growth-regulated alpha protein-like [Nothobranchius furzeri]
MNPSVQCLVILITCVVICNSATLKTCQCVKTRTGVNLSLISEVREYEPHPYCSKHEVIVILKDKSSRCLDPESNFTKAILRTVQAAHGQSQPPSEGFEFFA